MSKTHLTALFLYIYFSFIAATDDRDLIVCPPTVGCIRGTTMDGYQKGPFEAFMGIPYAEPPIGALRFQSPKIKARWFNTYDATKFKSDCIQKNYLSHNPTVFGNENCLYLNIYRPKVRLRLLPVMIYIQGWGFFSGSAHPKVTGPEYIMDTESVILVTMSYRLGALGFMSTGDYNMPGNFGLKDQSLVFKWVRRNIVTFDGDNAKVTIFGQSAGAVATHMHLINPYSKNLFHRVISMSGTANVPFAITTNPLELARETAKLCAIPNADTLSTAKLTEALRNVNATTLINAGDGLKHWDGQPLAYYRPVVEPPSLDAIIPAAPEKLMKSIYFQKRPWLLGTVPQEGAALATKILENPTSRQRFNLRFDFLLEELIEWPNRFTKRQAKDKTEIVVEEYFDGIFCLEKRTKAGFIDTISDRDFKHPLYEAIFEYLQIPGGKYPHYMYSFNYKGPYSYAKYFTRGNVTGKYGVVHCDDLIYLFRSPYLFPDFHKDSVEAKVIQKFVKYFVDFATFGYLVDVPPIGFCGTNVLDSRPHGICDYHEFVNNDKINDGFEVVMFRTHLTVLSLCLHLAFSVSATEDEKLIVCPPKVGCLKGTTMNGYQKGPFEAFLGIPYAEPPIGALRFQSPKIKARWFNTYDATKFKSDCIQKNYFSPNPTVFGNENCLYLNIYRPKVRVGLLPVMIYIQGWGFFSGSANPKVTGPEYIMDSQSVILVTMCYRLGALGFMSTGDDNMPGNFGLKDQSLVFKWVRRNIVSFDGNNKKVTIFGHGAGAVATHMHLINPYSKNLFHRVISMSGTANVPFAITTNPLEQARETAKLCAIPNADTLSTAKLTEALRNVNAKTLINAGSQLPVIYRPVVEPPSIDAIIPAAPEKLMKSIYFQKRPWLLGTVPQEGVVNAIKILENAKLRRQFNLRFEELLEELIEWPNRFTPRHAREKTEIIISQYFDGIFSLKNETAEGLIDTITDRAFKHPLYEAIYEYLQIPGGKFPHYMYSFN
ncbi:esterase-5B-like, partial [Drosophila tropicalis]|uniref:esterase-5B-like n=1 Tax=Drosophila tropicalis TaxID=46794 RepID=UPI0035AB786B